MKKSLLFGLITLCVLFFGCNKKAEVKENAVNAEKSEATESANESVKEAIETIILSENEGDEESEETVEDSAAAVKQKFINVEVGVLNGPSGMISVSGGT